MKPEEVVESLLWPRRQVKEGYRGLHRRDRRRQDSPGLQAAAKPAIASSFAIPPRGSDSRSPRSEIEELRADGTLMPDGLASRMSPTERRDLVRFLFDLGRPSGNSADMLLRHSLARAEFPYDRAPLHPEQWPTWKLPVNRERIYDFYAKEAEYFSKQKGPLASACRNFPGSTAARPGTGATRTKRPGPTAAGTRPTWARSCAASFAGAGVTVPKGVCVRLGENGRAGGLLQPRDALLRGRLERWLRQVLERASRLDGRPDHDGTPLPRPEGKRPTSRLSITGFTGTASESSSPIGSATSNCSTLRGSRMASSCARSRRSPSIRWPPSTRRRPRAVAAESSRREGRWAAPARGPT